MTLYSKAVCNCFFTALVDFGMFPKMPRVGFCRINTFTHGLQQAGERVKSTKAKAIYTQISPISKTDKGHCNISYRPHPMDLSQQQLCAWVETPGPDAKIEFRDIEVPKPGPNEVLVRLEVSGVWLVWCKTEISKRSSLIISVKSLGPSFDLRKYANDDPYCWARGRRNRRCRCALLISYLD